MVPGGINHWQRWFFNGFSNFGDQWLTMVTGRESLIMRFLFTKNEIRNKMRVNKDVKNRNKHGMKTENTQVDINQGTSCWRHSIKKRFLILQKLSLVCLISASARQRQKFTTIAKNQLFLRGPLPLVEWYLLNHWDQWFFDGFSVIGGDVFQWLPTIGPTMRW